MAFLSALKKFLNPQPSDHEVDLEAEREALRKAWNLDADDPVLNEGIKHETDPTGVGYDEHLWHNKLIGLCSESAETGRENLASAISELMGESRNLGLAPQKVYSTAQVAFEILVRQVVADRRVTLAEHAALDSVRDSLCLPNDVAANILEKVVQEAESVFQSKIEGL